MSQLNVNVVCARNIPGEWHERADPYVKVRYGTQVKKTRTDKEGGKNPSYNQVLTFDLREEPYVLEVEIIDNDPVSDDKLAEGVVEFRPAVEGQPVRGSFPVRGGMFGGNHGEIELEISVE